VSVIRSSTLRLSLRLRPEGERAGVRVYHGASMARGRRLLFIRTDVEIFGAALPGWVQPPLTALVSDPLLLMGVRA
jgi:hypothetical protein